MRKENDGLLFHIVTLTVHLFATCYHWTLFSTELWALPTEPLKLLPELPHYFGICVHQEREITGCEVKPLRTMFEALQSKFLQDVCRLSGYVLPRHQATSLFSDLWRSIVINSRLLRKCAKQSHSSIDPKALNSVVKPYIPWHKVVTNSWGSLRAKEGNWFFFSSEKLF